MKFFADTANTDEISYCFDNYVNDGITTNPKIMELTGDLSEGFDEACKKILDKYPTTPVSLETDLRGIDVSKIEEDPLNVRDVLLEQANNLVRLGENVVVKIPICQGGILATERLSTQGIKTNVTACMTPYQALCASNAGATYVSLFANRMLDSHLLELAGYSLQKLLSRDDWKDFVKKNKQSYLEQAWEITNQEIAFTASELDKSDYHSKLIVGSLRSYEDILRISESNPQIITIPYKIVHGLVEKLGPEGVRDLKSKSRTLDGRGVYIGDKTLSHPMTQYTLEEFEKSADSYRRA